MKIPNKLFLALLIGSALVTGIALASWELVRLNRAISAAHSVASAIAHGDPQSTKMSVSVKLFHGLIPVGRVEHPYRVIAVGDFFLGALAGGLAFLLVYTLIVALRRSSSRPPQSK